MRHLVYMLLVANLAYLGWNIFTSGSQQTLTVNTSPQPANVVPLITLQERQAASAAADKVTEIEQLTEEQPPGAGVAMLCQAMGPFLALEDMLLVEKHLLDLGLTPAPRHLADRELNGYWVYLPAMAREDVWAVTETLQEHRDKEYYVGKGNFISLGTFKGVERAQRRLQDVQEMGLDAILEERYNEQDSWWLDIQSDGSAKDHLLGIVDRHESIQLVDLACY